MGWNHLPIPKLQPCSGWSLGMDKWFDHTLYWTCYYLSMLRSLLIPVNKRGPRSQCDILANSLFGGCCIIRYGSIYNNILRDVAKLPVALYIIHNKGRLTEILAWISKHILYFTWDVIIHPFYNFIEVLTDGRARMSNYNPYLYMDVICYQFQYCMLILLKSIIKRVPSSLFY